MLQMLKILNRTNKLNKLKKLNKLNKKNKSVLFGWIISYGLILMLPILIGSIVYIETDKVIKNETERSNSLLLRHIGERVDNHLRSLERLSLDIMFNPRFLEKGESKYSGNNAFDAFSLLEATKELKAYNISNVDIEEIYLYYKNTDTVISSTMTSDSSIVHRFLFPNNELSYIDWQSLLNANYKGEFMPFYSIKGDGSKGNSIAYMRSFPISTSALNSINVLILISEEKFIESIKDIEKDGAKKIFILDNKDKVIMPSSHSNILDGFDWSKLTGASGRAFEKIKSERFVISYNKSQVTDWRYVSLMPIGAFLEKSYRVGLITFIAVLFCLILGSIIIYIMAKRNYFPLMDLINSFRSETDIQIDKGKNEYDYIRQAINSMVQEKKEISNKLEKQKSVLRNNFLIRLLKGQEKIINTKESLDFFGVSFLSDHFATIIFYIEYEDMDIDTDTLEFELNENIYSFKEVKFIMTNVIEELIGQSNRPFMLDMDEMMCCLVSLSDGETEKQKHELSKAVSDAKEFINKNFNINFKAAFSNIQMGIDNLPIAYEQSMQALEYILVMGTEKDVHYSEIEEVSGSHYNYSIGREQQLINCIKTGNVDESKKILDDLYKKHFGEKAHSVLFARCLVFDLVSTLIKVIDEMPDKAAQEFLNQTKEVLSYDNINDIKQKLNKIIEDVCEYVSVNDTKTTGHLKDDVIQYVESNYANENLNISMIAEHFNMHPVYISKTFKEQEGISLAEYINKIRINKAKELIKKNEMKLSDISNAVGYSSVRTFNRIFKKEEAITPSQYAQISKDSI